VTVFVDTSAFYALASLSDEFHEEAKEKYRCILDKGVTLFTSSGVLIETMALIQRRLGFDILIDFINAIGGIIKIVWITEDIYQKAWKKMAVGKNEQISIVDWTSFEIMRDMNIERTFSFDVHFHQQGFLLL